MINRGTPSLRDIAQRCGVSAATVSFALRGRYGVSEATRERVLSVAASLGYDLRRLRRAEALLKAPAGASAEREGRVRGQPAGRRRSTGARVESQTPPGMPGLASASAALGAGARAGSGLGLRRRLGVVYPAEGGLEAVERAADYGQYLRGIESAARELGVDLLFIPTVNGDLDPLMRSMMGEPLAGELGQVGQGRASAGAGVPGVPDTGDVGAAVDGTILLGLGDEAPAVRRALRRPAPVVLLSRYVPELPCSWICVDHERAAAMMTEHLFGSGYRQVVFVGGDTPDHSWEHQRRRGYRSAVLAHGLEPLPTHDLAPPDGEVPALLDHLERLVREANAKHADEAPAVAIFAAPDALALRVREGLLRRGLRAPEDYGLAGYGNLADRLAGDDAQLTSIGFPREHMGRLAVTMLLMLCGDRSQERQHVVMAPELHVRFSTHRPVPGASSTTEPQITSS
jgi:DNA-binding LacI/PurR family transcriptional regulator